jgi:hypothetical protein
MMPNKEALEILLGALSDAEWEQLKLLKETKSAFSTNSMIQYRKQGAIQFANWILKHTIMPGYDADGAICWVIANGSGETLSSPELYNEYMNGRFIQPIYEEDEDE